MPNEHSNTPSPGQRPQTIPLSQIHDLPGVFNPKPVESKLGSMIPESVKLGKRCPLEQRRKVGNINNSYVRKVSMKRIRCLRARKQINREQLCKKTTPKSRPCRTAESILHFQ